MKRLIVLLLFPLVVFASAMNFEQKIYAAILQDIFPHQSTIAVWSDDKEIRNLLQTIVHVRVVASPKDANFLIIKYDKEIKGVKGYIFAASYRILKYYKDEAIGGFFWQKGRPNVIFLAPNLKKKSLQLPKDLEQYIENEL